MEDVVKDETLSPCIRGPEGCSMIRGHIFVNKLIPKQTKVRLVYALGRWFVNKITEYDIMWSQAKYHKYKEL